jgi:hypothetical protein
MSAVTASLATRLLFAHAVDARGCHSSHVAVLPVAGAWLHALERLAGSAYGEDVRDLAALPHEQAARVHALFDEGAPVLRVGPVISLQKIVLQATQELQVENFLRLPPTERHKGPNQLIVNLAQRAVAFDWVPVSVQQMFAQRPWHMPDSGRQPLPPESGEPEMRTLTLPPGHALLMPADLVFHRACASAEVLVARGFFQLDTVATPADA